MLEQNKQKKEVQSKGSVNLPSLHARLHQMGIPHCCDWYQHTSIIPDTEAYLFCWHNGVEN
jgi:hypothetical protein